MLEDCGALPGSYGVLERLPRLRRLACKRLSSLPACLSRLTGLEELLLVCIQDETGLDAALQRKTGLTSL